MMHHLHMSKQQASPEPPKSEPTVSHWVFHLWLHDNWKKGTL
jgi:hypothetical protein